MKSFPPRAAVLPLLFVTLAGMSVPCALRAAGTPPDGAREVATGDDLARLRAALASRLAATDPAAAAGELKDRDSSLSHAVLVHEFLRTTAKGDPLKAILERPRGAEFVRWLLGSPEVLEDYLVVADLLSASDERTTGLNLWYELYLADPEVASTGLWRRVSTAFALRFGDRQKEVATAPKLYDYYKRNQKAGRLLPCFGEGSVFDLCFTIYGCNVEDMEWFLDAAPEKFRKQDSVANLTHHLHPYRLNNYRGRSIHGTDMGWDYFDFNRGDSAMNLEYGGVCGSISHFGAHAAVAHGVPAFTCGQPGHCAFVWKNSPTSWAGNNFVSGWETCADSHQQRFWHSGRSAHIHHIQAVLNAGKLPESARWRALARAYPTTARAAAEACLARAVAVCPGHVTAWEDRIANAREMPALPPATWDGMARDIAKAFEYAPLLTVDLLGRFDRTHLYRKNAGAAYAATIGEVCKAMAAPSPDKQWHLQQQALRELVRRQLGLFGVPAGAQDALIDGRPAPEAWKAVSAEMRPVAPVVLRALILAGKGNKAALEPAARSYLTLVANDPVYAASAMSFLNSALQSATSVDDLGGLAGAILPAMRRSAAERADLVSGVRRRLSALLEQGRISPAATGALTSLLDRYDFRESVTLGAWTGGAAGPEAEPRSVDITAKLAGITAPANLQVCFRWAGGAPGEVYGVTLQEDSRDVATVLPDKAKGVLLNGEFAPAVYSLPVDKPKPGARYRLLARVKGAADTRGVIMHRLTPRLPDSKDWVRLEGWGPEKFKVWREITVNWHEVELDVTSHVARSGPVFVRTQYASYGSASAMNARLYENGVMVSQDPHSAHTRDEANRVWTLTLPRHDPAKKYTLRLLMEKADGWGDIQILKTPPPAKGV